MKRLILGVAAALCLSAAAAADGLPSRSHVKSYEPVGPNWNGFSIGLGIGGSTAVTDLSVDGFGEFDGIGGEGVFGTVSLGYDRVIRPGWVAGVFVDYDFGGAETDASGEVPVNQGTYEVSYPSYQTANASLDQNYSWSVGARLGFLTNPSTLVYGTAGYTQSEFELSLLGYSKDETFSGYFLGAGIETVLHSNWTGKLEYRYSQFGDEDFGTDGVVDFEPSVHAVRAVLTYKFGHRD